MIELNHFLLKLLFTIQGTTSASLIGKNMGTMVIMGATITNHGVGTMHGIIGTTVMVSDFYYEKIYKLDYIDF